MFPRCLGERALNERLQMVASGLSEPRKGLGGWIAGRARRREFWAWIVPVIVGSAALELAGVPGSSLIMALPALFAMIRRLHDLGRSGWLAPLINVGTNVLSFAFVMLLGRDNGAILSFLLYVAVVITLGVLPGEPRDNAYGPPPGGRNAGDLEETFS